MSPRDGTETAAKRTERKLRRSFSAVLLFGAFLPLGLFILDSALAEAPTRLQPAIEAAHPGVPWIDTASLAADLTQAPRPILLDVREEAEFAVSHLEGAHRISPNLAERLSSPDGDAIWANLRQRLHLESNDHVVVYCSVGYRSAALGQALIARGVRVRNLLGGLFQWANEGRPLVRQRNRQQQTATRVHPYDQTWGRFLEANRRAPLP